MAHSRAKREVMMEMTKKKPEKAGHSKDTVTKKEAILAETLRNFKRKG